MKIWLLIFMIILTSCAHFPTYQEVRNTDFGPYPDNYKEVILKFFRKDFTDPKNVIFYNWKGPYKGWLWNGFQGAFFGYRVCVEVTIKTPVNRFRKYLHHFVINNDMVIKHTDIPVERVTVETYNYYCLPDDSGYWVKD